jgi:hypothetical protein
MKRSRIKAAFLLDAADVLRRWSKRLRARARRYEPRAADLTAPWQEAVRILAAQFADRPDAPVAAAEEVSAESADTPPCPSCPCGAVVASDNGLCAVHLDLVSHAWIRPRPQS